MENYGEYSDLLVRTICILTKNCFMRMDIVSQCVFLQEEPIFTLKNSNITPAFNSKHLCKMCETQWAVWYQIRNFAYYAFSSFELKYEWPDLSSSLVYSFLSLKLRTEWSASEWFIASSQYAALIIAYVSLAHFHNLKIWLLFRCFNISDDDMEHFANLFLSPPEEGRLQVTWPTI